MNTLVINHSNVRELLPMKDCIDKIAQALKALALGNGIQPLRTSMRLPPDIGGILGMMPAYMGDVKIMGIKAISVFPGNQNSKYDTHQGVVMLFETEYGRLQAIVDASEITAIRTAAASGVATDLLSRKDACNLAILGSGTQARGHLEAMHIVRNIKKVRVWSLPLEHAQEFAKRESEKYGFQIEAMDSAKAAVENADIVCTVTSATEPILFGDYISEGTHINAVGSSTASSRELDTRAVQKSRLFVDRRESTINEAGDFLFPKKEGAIDDDHIQGEIGGILAEIIKGRESEEEITLFKSLGLGIEDVAAAHLVYQKAQEKRLGVEIDMGGVRLENIE